MSIDLRRNRHSYYKLNYHLVVVTKNKEKVINEMIFERLKEISNNIFLDSWDCEIVEFSGDNNYLHIFFEAPPQVQLSKLINNFKTVTSRLIRKEFKPYLDNFYNEPGFWNNSYLILSKGEITNEVIEKYIKDQD